MKTPKKYIDSARSAQLLECSYQIFQRKHARQIDCIQLYDNGPRLFLESDVKKYKEGLAA